jgi:hypothetical protein
MVGEAVGDAIANPGKIVESTVSELEHFLSVLFEVLIPVIFAIFGMIVGPQVFTGGAIGDAMYVNGLTATISASSPVPWSILIGTLAGAAIVGTAAAALWKYQAGKSGLGGWIARSGAGLAVGWAFGILFRVVSLAMSAQTPFNFTAADGAIDRWIFQGAQSVSGQIQQTASPGGG